MVVFFKDLMMNKEFQVQFKYGQRRYMSTYSFICAKEEVRKWVEVSFYNLPKRGDGELLTI